MTVRTGAVQATPAGGQAPYTYQWAMISRRCGHQRRNDGCGLLHGQRASRKRRWMPAQE
ncbi:SprB repeat-containing protein [Sphingomonas sp. MMS24-JH45]